MKIRIIFPVAAILLILGVATCNYLLQKRNMERVIRDDKAISK